MKIVISAVIFVEIRASGPIMGKYRYPQNGKV